VSALQIRILLHYYSHTNDYDGGESGSFVEELVTCGMLEKDWDEHKRQRKLSDKGLFYVEYLLSVPMPSSTYIIQRDQP